VLPDRMAEVGRGKKRGSRDKVEQHRQFYPLSIRLLGAVRHTRRDMLREKRAACGRRGAFAGGGSTP